MVNQNKIFSFKIKRKANNVFSSGVERTTVQKAKLEGRIRFQFETALSKQAEKGLL